MKTRLSARSDTVEERRGAAHAPAAAQLKHAPAAAAMPDTRATSLAQLQHQDRASNSSHAAQLKDRAAMMAGRNAGTPVQRVEDEEPLQGKFAVAQRESAEELLQGKLVPVQRTDGEDFLEDKFAAQPDVQLQEKPNSTGMPNQLKAGIESLSGMSMDHVKVHYNSDKPAQMNAHAYAQGSEIHMAPGQEQHLPHEAWHVVQQMQGRVTPTIAIAGKPVNDNPILEYEATSMGNKALQKRVKDHSKQGFKVNAFMGVHSDSNDAIQRQLIDAIDVTLEGTYPRWTQAGIDWHLTMKDPVKWHITKSDRSMSYWFTVDAGTVTSMTPRKQQYGSHREKHGALDDAPSEVKVFIVKNISEIIRIK